VINWQPIETAPVDREITLCAGEVIFKAEWTCGFEDENGMTCTWAATGDDHPKDWCEGVCWSVNSNGDESTKPVAWRD